MKVNADCFYQIGSSHKICEDFALVGKSPLGLKHFALVSDGCSGSLVDSGVRNPLNVDIGARFLALAAKKAISDRYTEPEEENAILQEKILENLKTFKGIYELPSSVFDATLILALLDQLSLRIFWFGDGVAVIETDTFIDVITVEFLSRAPYYLSYQLSKDRFASYQQEFLDQSMLQTWWRLNKKDQEPIKSYQEFIPTSYQTNVYSRIHEYRSLTVTIFTDGVNTFNTEDKVKDILECSTYPATTGAYAWKRMNLTNKWMKKNGLYHYDDLGMASMHLEKD